MITDRAFVDVITMIVDLDSRGSGRSDALSKSVSSSLKWVENNSTFQRDSFRIFCHVFEHGFASRFNLLPD